MPGRPRPQVLEDHLGRGLSTDVHRTYRLHATGWYDVTWAVIPPEITPKNRIVIAVRRDTVYSALLGTGVGDQGGGRTWRRRAAEQIVDLAKEAPQRVQAQAPQRRVSGESKVGGTGGAGGAGGTEGAGGGEALSSEAHRTHRIASELEVARHALAAAQARVTRLEAGLAALDEPPFAAAGDIAATVATAVTIASTTVATVSADTTVDAAADAAAAAAAAAAAVAAAAAAGREKTEERRRAEGRRGGRGRPGPPSSAYSRPPASVIGHIESCWAEKNGTPRQGRANTASRARLTLPNGDCSIGLEAFSHVWVLFHFHLNSNKRLPMKV